MNSLHQNNTSHQFRRPVRNTVSSYTNASPFRYHNTSAATTTDSFRISIHPTDLSSGRGLDPRRFDPSLRSSAYLSVPASSLRLEKSRAPTIYESVEEAIQNNKKLVWVYIIVATVLSLALLILIATNNLPRLIPSLGSTTIDIGYTGLAIRGQGEGTFYNPGVGIGACEWLNQDDELVAALNWQDFGAYTPPRASPACGACLKITGPKGTVKVKVVDKCPVCKKGDIDLSPAAFQQIASVEAGRVKITWSGCK